MVIKGRARGGPVALAKHLERRDTNETVSVRELRGVTARDVAGALREMDCMGAGALSDHTLYHAAINTAPNERLTEAQKERAIDRLEAELGFVGQPRIVVEHLKKGREHIHVVFLRIDTDRMVAISDSHNYRRHEIVARDLEREFGHERVQGAHIGREDQERPERTPGHDEMQQAERSGLSPKAAKEQITRLWNQADSGMAFAAAVKNAGWVLARGDRRDFVLIDVAGETHSLARRIEGARAANVRRSMSDIDPASLPSTVEAREMQRTQVKSVLTKENGKDKTKAPHAPDPVILKVAAPTEKFSALPLELAAGVGCKTEKEQKLPPKKKSLKSESQSPPEKSQISSSIKRLYKAAVEKTRKVFQKKRYAPETIARPNPSAERPAPASKPALATGKHLPQFKPTQEAMRRLRAEARATDRKTLEDAVERPKDTPPIADRDEARENRCKLSREDIEKLLERQRRKRERGPSH